MVVFHSFMRHVYYGKVCTTGHREKQTARSGHLHLMADVWASGPSRRRGVGTVDRRPRLKALAAASAQERRRQDCISKQKQVSDNYLRCIYEATLILKPGGSI